MTIPTKEINIRVARTIQTLVFLEYLVVYSTIVYNIFLTIFAITDIPNISYYLGIIAFSMFQYLCNGINYRINKEEHCILQILLMNFFTLMTIGEIVLISYMIQTMPLMLTYVKVIFCLILIKDSLMLTIGICAYGYLQKLYNKCESAKEYHQDTMRRLGQHAIPEYNYKLVNEIFDS